MSSTWFINIQVTSSSKTRSHVDFRVRNNIQLGILKNIYLKDPVRTT